tara:strand:- start:749 stop:907 length:159 start_codon:yes stop_codon:yes gene_type:complete
MSFIDNYECFNYYEKKKNIAFKYFIKELEYNFNTEYLENDYDNDNDYDLDYY